MSDPPQLDGRRAAALRATVTDLAPYYTDDWDPEAGGVGAALADVFAELGAEVTERLDAAPAKHRVAFYDALGFRARPPQAARVPVQYTLAPDAPRNVAVRPGTTAVAAADGDVEFHVGAADAFEATPAQLTDVLAVDPVTDAIYDHGGVINGGECATPWVGPDRQAHDLYIGDADLLSAGDGDEIVIDVTGAVDAGVLRHDVEWAYYGVDAADGSEGWQRLAVPGRVRSERTDGDLAIELEPYGDLVEHAVDGVESRWLRGRLPARPPTGPQLFDIERLSVRTASGGAGGDPARPARLLANDVPQENPGSAGSPIRPFGDQPRPSDTFYVGAPTALSKAGAVVTLTFTPVGADGNGTGSAAGGEFSPDMSGAELDALLADLELPSAMGDWVRRMMDVDADPMLSWEYYDGEGWSTLSLLTDETDRFTASSAGDVVFEVPPDLAPTSVAGHESHWVRVRLVGGDYGDVIQVPEDPAGTQWAKQVTGAPPAFGAVELAYDLATPTPPSHVRTHNALSATDHDPTAPFRPFTRLPESEQTLYLGFDAPLSGGPLQLFVGVDEHPYTAGFTPRLRWERRHHANPGWVRPEVRDDTAGLTEEGTLGLAFAEPTRATSRFGRTRHWVRARVTGERFDPAAAPAVDAAAGASADGADGGDATTAGDGGDRGGGAGDRTGLEACATRVATAPPGGEPSTAPPRLTGLHLNTGWARNVRLVEGELLGGSDGERDQTFAVSTPPAVDVEVWVDEASVLSEPQRETLVAERPADVELERTADGDVRTVWVRWTVVEDLLGSGPEDRHVAVDAVDGELRFGDGTRGRIPPRGTNNVRASYRTGGGAAGNVPAGVITELESGLPFVDAVRNPAPGAGGADAESTTAVLDRAPQTLKDRNRAVLPADYERLAADASRRVARAKCVPGMDRAGEPSPGWVTVLVVPQASGETPVPSVGLLDRVETGLAEHAPASVVGGDRLVVRGPSYVSVGVEADVVAGDVGSVGAVEEALRDAVAAFLHPLSGRGGDGWSFGTLPTRSDVFALLEAVEGVDHVASLFLTFTGTDTVTVGAGEPRPDAPADALVRGGDHDLTVSLGGGR